MIADIFYDDNLCDQQGSYIILKMLNSIPSSTIWDSDRMPDVVVSSTSGGGRM